MKKNNKFIIDSDAGISFEFKKKKDSKKDKKELSKENKLSIKKLIISKWL